MTALNQLVVFTLNDQRYALTLSAVERIVRIVEVTPLPKAPDIVLGVVKVGKRVIPVVDTRKRFRLPEKDVDLSDLLIIARTSKRIVALLVEEVIGVVDSPEQKVLPAEKILPGIDYVEGVLKTEDGLIIIHDINTFLSLEEEKTLDRSLNRRKGKR